MIRIVWEYRVAPGREREFQRHYAADGTWAAFFRGARAYRRTELMRDIEDPQRFLTVDYWDDLKSYQDFRNAFRHEYEALDRQMEDLTLAEEKLGIFTDLV
jgi:heme-degrading monooxygenase HmoA